MTKQQQFDLLFKELRSNHDLPLYPYRELNTYFPVLGEGSLDADIFFIGEAPGEEEAKTDRPFIGASGKFLTQMIEEYGLSRDEVFITNVVHDRPPENRDPTDEEIEKYSKYTVELLRIIRPKIIVTLGRFAMNWLAGKYNMGKLKIGEEHGVPRGIPTNWGEVYFVPLYHPAVALYNGSQRNTLTQDFAIVLEVLEHVTTKKPTSGET